MMYKVQTDVDIDVFDRETILAGTDCIFARIENSGSRTEKHPTGVYFQDIPRDIETNISTIDYKSAGDLGYFKIDFLNVNMYEGIRNEDHLTELLAKEPEWELFCYQEITDQLFHLNGYSHLLTKFRPSSVEELAMVLAIIRPSKAYLQKEEWEKVKKEVWLKTGDGYQFKRSHGIAYALAVIVHLNLLIEQLSKN